MKNNLSPRTTRRVLLWVGALAVVVRLFYFSEHSTSPFFAVPLLDGKYYDTVARYLVEGRDVSNINPGFRPFLYPVFLAAFYQLAGPLGPSLALAAQHLLGVVTTVLVAWLALRLYRRPAAGALAGGLYALAGPPLFFEGELLITGLYTLLALLPLVVLAGAKREASPSHWFVAAALVGLAAQARPNILLFLAAFGLAALWGLRRRRRVLPAAGAALAGLGVVLVVFAFLTWPLLGRFQLLPSSGGVNFYLGNKAGADGMIPRQDEAVSYGDEYRDSVQVFAVEGYLLATGAEPSSPGEVSSFWFGRAMEGIREDPGRWLGLMARKVVFLVWDREIPNNKNYAFVREHESSWLRLMPVRFWLLFALAPLGAVFAWYRGDRSSLFWLLTFLGTSGVGIVLFFVNSRYRAPLWPVLAVLAAGGLLALGDAVRRKRWGAVGGGMAVAALLALVSLVNWLNVSPQSFSRDFFFRSLAHLERGDVERAAADARRSIELDPSDPAALCQLGNVAMVQDDLETAYTNYRAAAELAPREPRVYNNLAILNERTGRPGEAYRGYLFAIFLAEDFAPALVNAALLELRAGLLDRAAEHIEKAESLGYESITLDCARAFLDGASGRVEEARSRLLAARAQDPETVERLAEIQQQRLTPEDLLAGLPPP